MKLFFILLFFSLYNIAAHAQSPGPSGNALGLNPGLATNPTTYNAGGQSAQMGKNPISLQFFYDPHATSCNINSTCGSVNDSGKILVATASGVTFTMPNPGAAGTAGQNFGYDGSHTYTITTVSGTAQITGCGVTGTSITIGYAAQLFPTGSGYSCVPSSGVSLAGQQTWSAGNSQTPIALTDAATINVNALLGNIFSVTLGGNRALACPTGLPSGQDQFLTFTIKQDGTGNRTLTPSNTCYKWTNSAFPQFSTIANAEDLFTCLARASSADLLCGLPLPAFGTSTSPAVLRSVNTSPGDGPTQQITLNGYTGHPLIVGVFNCEGSGCVGTSTAAVTNITDSVGSVCSFISNSLTTTVPSGLVTQIWKCTGGSSGNDTLTITCGGGDGCFFIEINVSEISVINGICEIGNHQAQTGQNISIPTSGSTTSSNEFIYSITNKRDETVTSGQTFIGSVGHSIASFQIASSLGVYINTYTGTDSANYAASIAACK